MNIMIEQLSPTGKLPATVIGCGVKAQAKTRIVLGKIKTQTGCVSEHSIVQVSKLPSITNYKACFESQDHQYCSQHTTISTEKLLLILEDSQGYQPSQESIENLQSIKFDEEDMLSFNAAL